MDNSSLYRTKRATYRGFALPEVLMVIVIIIMIVSMFTLPPRTCEQQADLMGMRHSWGHIQGCMIEHAPGKWIPMKNYRAGDQPK